MKTKWIASQAYGLLTSFPTENSRRKKRWVVVCMAAMLALLAAGCNDGFTDAAMNAMQNNAAQENGSKGPTMEGGTIDENGVLTKYEGDAAEVVIPEGVTGINSWAFIGCSRLTSVTIPDSVTSIGNNAFKDCTNLASVTIPASVEFLGWDAFDGCDNLTEIEFLGTKTQWKALRIGFENIHYIQCSDGYLGVKEVPEGLVMSGTKVTGYTSSFAGNLVIPDGVTGIGDYAFKDCTNLASVTIPASVESIGYSAFNGCTSLVEVKYTGTFEQWCVMDNDCELMAQAKTVTISDVTELKCLTTLEIPKSVERIGKYAFYWCKSLASVTISDSVTSIGDWAFSECESLVSVTMPASVERIGYCAFRRCTDLKSVTIPDSVMSIGNCAFEYCESLTEVKYTGTLAQWCAMNNDCFHMVGEKTVTMSDGTDLKSLTTLEIPKGVTSIGTFAFSECTKLESVTIPEGVTGIGLCAFSGCESLENVTIPASVTSIGKMAFYDCTSLATIHYEGTQKEWEKINRFKSYFDNSYDDGLSGKTITGKGGTTWIAE